MEGEDARFTCSVSPKSTPVKWMKGGNEISQNEHCQMYSEDTDHILIIFNTKTSDSGGYSVKVGQSSRKMHLKVTGYFLEEPSNVECMEGEDARFTCKVSPRSTPVKWMKGGNEISQNEHCQMYSEDTDHILIIFNTKTSDSGGYSVKVGQSSRKMHLKVTVWNSVLKGQKIDNAPQTWSGKRRSSDDSRKKYIYRTPARTIMDESDTPDDSDEMPSYSCLSPNSPNGRKIWTYSDEREVCYGGKTEKKKQPEESLRDFGQAIEDMYRTAYPDTPEIVEEKSIKAFLDKCGQSEDFRLAVERTRPKTLQEAVNNSMREECLRAGEKDLAREYKPVQRPIFEAGEGKSSPTEEKKKTEYR
ncbi:TTN [Mytilus coruscus]|uniref:TTN n=1 Tax=Mytilus coruscus TaxID=42192 RepID=A0A6J8B2A9_MYTCO|nr:TTN [Mytilus coruscus]